MTERLYYDNAYLTEFDGVVEKVSERDGKQNAALNRSAFYPTSGGQPFDTGTLNGARVTPSGDEVSCSCSLPSHFTIHTSVLRRSFSASIVVTV